MEELLRLIGELQALFRGELTAEQLEIVQKLIDEVEDGKL